MKKIPFALLVATMLLAASVSACDMSNPEAEGYTNVSIEHAHQQWSAVDQSSIVFLDVRSDGEYQSGHVPGALHIPIQTLASRLSEVPTGKKLYVYCESGVRSTKAAKLLASNGFTQVENVKASMRGWRNAGYPIEK